MRPPLAAARRDPDHDRHAPRRPPRRLRLPSPDLADDRCARGRVDRVRDGGADLPGDRALGRVDPDRPPPEHAPSPRERLDPAARRRDAGGDTEGPRLADRGARREPDARRGRRLRAGIRRLGAQLLLETHFLGGFPMFRSWEIADIGFLVMFRRAGRLYRSKVALLQSKRLYPAELKRITRYAHDQIIGFGRLHLDDAKFKSVS